MQPFLLHLFFLSNTHLSVTVGVDKGSEVELGDEVGDWVLGNDDGEVLGLTLGIEEGGNLVGLVVGAKVGVIVGLDVSTGFL